MLEECRVFDGWKRLESRWTLIRGNERRVKTLMLRFYSGAELESLPGSAGFREVSLYGSLAAGLTIRMRSALLRLRANSARELPPPDAAGVHVDEAGSQIAADAAAL